MARKEVKYVVVTCDICGIEKEGSEIERISVTVRFLTDQTEGRPCAPYLQRKDLDLCEACIEKVIRVDAIGAQGYNNYSLKK